MVKVSVTSSGSKGKGQVDQRDSTSPRPALPIRPRVAVYTWMDPLNHRAGGDVKFLGEMARRLARDGVDVAWIASRAAGRPSREVFAGLDILRIGSLYSVFFLHHLDTRIQGLAPPDIRIETLSSVPFLLRGRGGTKDVLLIHHVVPFSQMWRKVGPMAPLAYILDRCLAPALYRDRRVMVPSKSTEREVRELGYHDVSIFKEGADSGPVEIADKEPLVVAPGPIKPWKHHEEIIRAFSLVEGDWKLVIFGSYESPTIRMKLERVARDCHVEARTQLLGWIPEDEKTSLLRRASLCALASEKEGWGLAAVEAQAFGCPVVGYDVPGLCESVVDGETGVLVEAGSVRALANALRSLMFDKRRREEMAESALSRMRRGFDWETCYLDFRASLGLGGKEKTRSPSEGMVAI